TQNFHDSGGDPRSIITLKYEDFTSFHSRYYNSSNGLIFLYGNISTEKHFKYLSEEILGDCTPNGFNPVLLKQEKWDKPKRFDHTYGILDSESLQQKTLICLSWLLPSDEDFELLLLLDLLSSILLGNNGSPLRKAVVESRLGEDLLPYSGMFSSYLESFFMVGLRGTDRDKTGPFVDLVLKTIEELCVKGIERKIIEAAFNRFEFSCRELTRGRQPLGIRYSFMVTGSWLHGYDPFRELLVLRYLKPIRRKIFKRGFISSLLKKYFLENNSRTLVVLTPEKGKKQREDDFFRNYIQETLARKGQGEKQASMLARLKEFQDTPDSDEDLAKLPSLNLSELPRAVKKYDVDLSDSSLSSPIYTYGTPTNGIVYLDFYFDIAGLDFDSHLYLPILAETFVSMGIPGRSYADVSREVALQTGGFSYYLDSAVTVSGECKQWLVFRIKLLKHKINAALDILTKLLLSVDLSDTQRLYDVLLEYKNNLKSGIMFSGSYFSSLRAASRIHLSELYEEKWGGIEQYLFCHKLLDSLSRDSGIIESLQLRCNQIRSQIINLSRLTLLIIASAPDLKKAGTGVENAFQRFPRGPDIENIPPVSLPDDQPAFESIAIPSSTGSVATALKGSVFRSRENTIETILTKLMANCVLIDRVRQKGGAYGVSAHPSLLNGVFSFSSYRDPNIQSTLQAYADGLKYIHEKKFTKEQLKRAIIGRVGIDEKPLEPKNKGAVGLKRRMLGITDEERQKRRDIVLGATPDDLSHAAELLLEKMDKSRTVVIAGSEIIEKESSLMPELYGHRINLP
ncbi:MAG: insulinase family protein, partial [Spirochaetales bacterium]|nr:insulinase family protein [Spirochaetales bacterium]